MYTDSQKFSVSKWFWKEKIINQNYIILILLEYVNRQLIYVTVTAFCILKLVTFTKCILYQQQQQQDPLKTREI